MDIILHIAQRDDWEQAEPSATYRADTLETQGFLHCSRPEQVVRVANSLYRGQDDLVLLCIESGRVEAEIRYENLEDGLAQSWQRRQRSWSLGDGLCWQSSLS